MIYYILYIYISSFWALGRFAPSRLRFLTHLSPVERVHLQDGIETPLPEGNQTADVVNPPQPFPNNWQRLLDLGVSLEVHHLSRVLPPKVPDEFEQPVVLVAFNDVDWSAVRDYEARRRIEPDRLVVPREGVGRSEAAPRNDILELE